MNFKENNMTFCFMQDDDGHNYLIPFEERELFEVMLEQGEEDYYERFIDKFSNYSIDDVYGVEFNMNKEQLDRRFK